LFFLNFRIRQRLDDETGLRTTGPPPPIITDKDLKGFDEILENDVQAGWATANNEIDYNAKLVFSDDEDSTPSKESNYDEQRDRSDNKQKIADWDSRDFDKVIDFDLLPIYLFIIYYNFCFIAFKQ
jgi:hypothetical protein